MTKVVNTYADALLVVQDLAIQNQVDERDVDPGDVYLAAQCERQSLALSTVQAFIDADGGTSLPAVDADGSGAPAQAGRADPVGDPSDLATAVRIALDLAKGNILDDDSEDMAGEVARQEMAVALVERLVARHGNDLAMPSSPRLG